MYEEFFFARLTKLRLAKNVSARDMSFDIGQNKNYINQIENGKAFPSMQGFFYICEYLNITPKDFFDEGKTNPALMDEFLSLLRKLDDESIRQLLGIASLLPQKQSPK